jgi:hypothetical protein
LRALEWDTRTSFISRLKRFFEYQIREELKSAGLQKLESVQDNYSKNLQEVIKIHKIKIDIESGHQIINVPSKRGIFKMDLGTLHISNNQTVQYLSQNEVDKYHNFIATVKNINLKYLLP